jgi:hypothetical protein
MKSLDFSRYALGICVASAMLAGCGGSQPPTGAPGAMPQSAMESAQDAHSGPLLYVSNDGEAHDVTVYRAGAKDPSPIETISSDLEQPGGICLDGLGTLYVTDVDGWVVEYPAGKTKPSKVITKGINTPAFCAIDSKGNLWVTNYLRPKRHGVSARLDEAPCGHHERANVSGWHRNRPFREYVRREPLPKQ